MDENKVVFVPHCILNQSVRVTGKEKSGLIKEIVELFVEAGIGIVQLPCPEVEYDGGLKREAKSRKAYETENYRNSCKKLSVEVLKNIKRYLDSNFKVIGILGVEFSPTCAVYRLDNGKKIVPGKGIFIEELEKEMQRQRFQVPIIATNLNNVFSTLEKIDLLLKNC